MKQKETINKNLASKSIPVFIAGLSSNYTQEDKIKAIQQVAEAATDFSWLKSKDTVFIKPVVNSGNAYPASTDPLAVIALIRLLKKKGAGRIIVGDLAGISNVHFHKNYLKGSTRKIMEQTGIAQAAISNGAELCCFEEAGWDGFYQEIPLNRTYWKKPLMLPMILKEVDHIILLPRCARHLMASSTLSMKAAIGYLRTDSRIELHQDADSFHEKIVEVNTSPTLLKKQRLVITVADKVLSTYGPNKGYIIQPSIGLVISSNSDIAHDMVSLAWLLENRKKTPQNELLSYCDVSKRFANSSNRKTVHMLSRKWFSSIRTKKLRKTDMLTIWDDPILKYAFVIFGGIPKIEIKSINSIIPEEILNNLKKAISNP